MRKDSNTKRKPAPKKSARSRPRHVTITSNYNNAYGIEPGTVVLVDKGAPFKDGDLVVFEHYGDTCAAYLYHSKGAYFQYFIKKTRRLANRRMLCDFQCLVVGPVVEEPAPTYTDKTRPRRSRMPQAVYDTADNADSRLADHTYYDGTQDPTDETLCQKIAAPLRELARLSDIETTDAQGRDVSKHPHNCPWLVAYIIKEAMRLAYGISDLTKATKAEQQLSRALFASFAQVRAVVEESEKLWIARMRSTPKQTKESEPEPEEVDATLDEVLSMVRRGLSDAEIHAQLQSRLSADAPHAKEVKSLKNRLDKLERLPENEATRFQLESEIYRLEHSTPEDDDSILDADLIGERGEL